MEELEKLHKAVSANMNIGDFEEFSSKMQDTDSRKRFYDAVSKEGFDLGDYNEYENRLSGSSRPTPTEPKGDVAEENGVSVSPSASTEESLSDTNNQNVKTKAEVDFIGDQLDKQGEPNVEEKVDEELPVDLLHPFLKTERPEIVAEYNQLKETIKNRPVMADNSEELARIGEIEQLSENYSKAPKSTKEIAKEQIQDLDSLILEQEKRADLYSKGSDMSFEEVLNNDGVYQDLKKSRDQVKTNLDRDIKKEVWDKRDLLGDTFKKIKANTSSAIAGIGAIPNYMNKTLFTLIAPQEMIDNVNELSPEDREKMINGVMSSAGGALNGMGQMSADIQKEFLNKADGINAEIAQFETDLTEDLVNGDYGQFSARVLSDGIGSIPSLVQAMIPYVGIGSIMIGSAANKQEELEGEGYGIGLDTSANSAINGVAEGLLEIVTKKLGSKIFKSLKGASPAARKTLFKDLYDNLIKAPLFEGGSEAATALIQNLSDIYIQGKEKDFNEVFSEVANAFYVGFGMGGGMGMTSQTIQTIKNVKNDVKIENLIKDESNDYNTIKDIFDPSKKDIDVDMASVVAMGGNLKFDKDIDRAVKEGEMTVEDADGYKTAYNETSLALSKTRGLNLTSDNRVEAMNLIREKDALKHEIKNMDDALATTKKQRVQLIDEKLVTMTTSKQEVRKTEGVEDTPSPTVELDPTNTSTVKNDTRNNIIKNTTEETSRITTLDKEAEDGATLNQDGTKYEGGGLVVPITSKNTTQGELTPELIADFIEEHSDQIDGDNVKVGIYKFPNSDQVSLDLNVVVDPANRQKALDFAKQAGQESLFDLETGENIKTGADGKSPKSFTLEQFKELTSSDKTTTKPVTKTVEKDGTTTKPKKGTTVKDAMNREVRISSIGGELLQSPIDGDLYTEGQRVILDTRDGKQYDLGNVNEIQDNDLSEISEFGIDYKQSNVTVSDKGNLSFNGNEYVKPTNVEKRTKRNASGDITFVKLKPVGGGKQIILRGQDAIDAYYISSLEDFSSYLDSGKVDPIIEQEINEEYEKNTKGKVSDVTKGDTIKNNESTQQNKKVDDTNKKDSTTTSTEKEGGGTKTDKGGKDQGTTKNVPKDKKISKKTTKMANTVRKMKVNSSVKGSMSKLNSRPTAIFEAAWDAAIETVATTLELTGDITQAIYDGVENLKNSDWYIELSKEGKAKAERMFREDLDRNFEGEEVSKPSFYDSVKASFAKNKEVAIQKLVDKYYILRKAISNNFDITDDSVNFSQAEKQMHGKAANDLKTFDKELSVVIKDIAKKGFTIKNVSDYLYAKHATERNKHIKDNVDPENEFGSGMTPQEATKILEGTYTEEQIKDLEELSDKFREIIQGTRDIMFKGGLITREQYNSLNDYYENYVPLNGFEKEDIEGAGQMIGSDIDVSGSQVRRAAGRSTRADNVIANIIAQRTAAILNARKNEVLQTLYRLATDQKNNDVVTVYAKKDLPKKLVIQSDGKKVTQPERPDNRKDYVGVKVDGEQYYLKFANAELGRVLNAANIEKTSLVGKTLGRMNRYLSATLTTLDPEFVISNFSRDIQTAVLNVMAEADINKNLDSKNIAVQVVRDTGKSIRAIYSNERKGSTDTEFKKFYNEFKEDGAKTGWANQHSLQDIKKKLEGLHKLEADKGFNFTTAKGKAKDALEFINDVNTSVENGVRLAAYINARKAGLTRPQAAVLAKELTVNFNQSGEWGTLFNSMYLFFNAAIQGNVRFIKAMTTLKKTVKPDGSVKKSLNRGQKLAGAMTVFASMLTILNQSISAEDDDGETFYNKIPDYEKERNLIFMNPVTGEDYFKIPLPYGYNIFHNVGTIATEVATGDRSVGDGIGFLTSATIGAFSPVSFGGSENAAGAIVNAGTPTIAKPIVDLARNEDYFGSQIYNEQFPFGVPKPDASMGRKTTPEAFKNMAVFLNEISGGNDHESGKLDFAPESFYHFFKFGVGGTGRFVSNITETASTGIDIAQGQDKEVNSRKLPFVRKVYAEPNEYVDQAQFFDRYDMIRQREEAIKARIKSKEATPEDRRVRGKVSATVKAYDNIAKQMSDIRKRKKRVEQITDPIKKTQKLNELDEKYYKLIKKANGFYNKKLGKNYE